MYMYMLHLPDPCGIYRRYETIDNGRENYEQKSIWVDEVLYETG